MVLGLFGTTNEVESTTEENSGGSKIATPSFTVTGSVHSSGEAYATVERLHADGETVPIRVRGSVHQTGAQDLSVDEHLDLDGELPEPSDDVRGFTSVVEDELRHNGSVHSPGNTGMDIEQVVVIPDDRPDIMVALHNAGYDVYDEVRIGGSVHDTGRVNVTIQDLYVYPDEQ